MQLYAQNHFRNWRYTRPARFKKMLVEAKPDNLVTFMSVAGLTGTGA